MKLANFTAFSRWSLIPSSATLFDISMGLVSDNVTTIWQNVIHRDKCPQPETRRQQDLDRKIVLFNHAKRDRDRDEILADLGIAAKIRPAIANKNSITARQRAAVLDWLLYHQKAEIEGDLVLHIFGKKQLKKWQAESSQRYPDFELVMAARNGREGLELCWYFAALPGAPKVGPESKFPTEPLWDWAELFWCSPEKTRIEYIWTYYPNQSSVANGSSCFG